MTLYFAIDQINKDSQLLPIVTLDFHVYNAFNSNKKKNPGRPSDVNVWKNWVCS